MVAQFIVLCGHFSAKECVLFLEVYISEIKLAVTELQCQGLAAI